MVNIGDTVHVYNEEFGADYQAVVLDVFDDGTSQVQTGTGIKYSVETADLHSLEVCPTLHAPDAAPAAAQDGTGEAGEQRHAPAEAGGAGWTCQHCGEYNWKPRQNCSRCASPLLGG